MLEVCLLGNSGYMPLPHRWLSALLVRYEGKMILFDCGEGTQIPYKMAGWGMKALEAIFITHFHCDHVAGLPGLLLSIGNSGREEPLSIIGPVGLEKIMKGLLVIAPQLPYDLQIIEVTQREERSISLCGLTIDTLWGDHGIACLAYCLNLKRQGKFDPQKAQQLGVPIKFWKNLQNGEIYQGGNVTVKPNMVMGEARQGIKVGFCTDTRPTDKMKIFYKDCDLLVCEGMYGEDEMLDKARENGHMTFREAAQIAQCTNSKEMWLTHFSPSMDDPSFFIQNAKDVFQNTILGTSLMKKMLHYS